MHFYISFYTNTCEILFLLYFCTLIIYLLLEEIMTALAIVGFLASLLSILNQFPQAIKVFRSHDTQSISLAMYIIVIIAISLWLVYGLMLGDVPLITANAISLIPITYIFIIKLKNTVEGKDKWSI